MNRILLLCLIFIVSGSLNAQETLLTKKAEGCAPFPVFFDAISDSSGVVQPPVIDGSCEYADLYYSWDFGDEHSGNWTPSGRSKNQDVGYLASHVYDQPGNYLVTLNVTDGEGEEFSYTQTITVLDPDTVFSGENTICVSTSGDFTGAPEDALLITTSDLEDLQSYLSPGKRILFRRGESWSYAGYFSFRNFEGPFVLSAFGPGINPDERGIFENAPIINSLGNAESGFIAVNTSQDIQISDLHFIGHDEEQSFAGGATDIKDFLIYRVHVEGFSLALAVSYYNTLGHQRIMIIESLLHDAAVNVVFAGAEQLVLLGNLIYNSPTSHVVRLWQAYKSIIGHNVLHGSSLTTTSGRQALKLHGPPQEHLLPSANEFYLSNRSKYIIIQDNVFGTSGPWPVTVSPQNGVSDERISDVVIDGNRFLAGYGSLSSASALVSTGLRIVADNVTTKNNLFDGTGGQHDYQAIIIAPSQYKTSIGNRIFNNTIFKNDYGEGWSLFRIVRIYEGAEDTKVQNNLIAFNGQKPQIIEMVLDEGNNTTASHNILSENQNYFIDPENENVIDRNFELIENTEPVDAGIQLPVFYDFNLNPRTQGEATDVGAYEFADLTSVGSRQGLSEHNIILLRNYPNPFNPVTIIEYYLPKAAFVSLEVINILGEKAEEIVNEYKAEGKHSVKFDASGLASGIYFYRLITDRSTMTKKMLILN